jgi:biotin transporter BioY
MKKNPLTSTIIVFAIGDAYTLWEAVTRGSVSVFTVMAWLQGIVLFGLYLRKSRYAGSYLFYSVIPLFPVYFGLRLLGLNPPPPSSAGYIIGFLVYVAAVILLWRQKRDYDHYIRLEAISPSTVS